MKNKITTLAGILLLALGSVTVMQAATPAEVVASAQADPANAVAIIKAAVQADPANAEAIVAAAVKAFPSLKTSIVAAVSTVPGVNVSAVSSAADSAAPSPGPTEGSAGGPGPSGGSNNPGFSFPTNPGDLTVSPSGGK